MNKSISSCPLFDNLCIVVDEHLAIKQAQQDLWNKREDLKSTVCNMFEDNTILLEEEMVVYFDNAGWLIVLNLLDCELVSVHPIGVYEKDTKQ